MADSNLPVTRESGHRKRLRERFQESSDCMTNVELLELLLTYAVPRQNVKPLAQILLEKYKSIYEVIRADSEDLVLIPGIGSSVILYFKLLEKTIVSQKEDIQPGLFHSDLDVVKVNQKDTREKRVFTDDETANSIQFLPMAPKYKTLEGLREFLNSNLPYNASSTRIRRASYILQRFFPSGEINTPFQYYLSKFNSVPALKSVVFYSIIKSEPLSQFIAEKLVYPNLPLGFIRQNQIEEYIRKNQPGIQEASVSKSANAVKNLYRDSDTGVLVDNRLVFHMRIGELEGFLYIFTSEFPEPGIYSFDALYQGPIHQWMLWGKEWIHKQLYYLRDLGVISKISEIDTINQFSVGMKQFDALKVYFENKDLVGNAIRENEKQ